MVSLKGAVKILKHGGLVGFPTESFFALAADATNPEAVNLIYTVKGRDKRKPIAVIASDFGQVERFFTLSNQERKLAKKYWPGSVTLLLKPRAPTTPAFGHPSPFGLELRAERSGRRGITADALFGTTPISTSFFNKTGADHPSFVRRGRVRIGVRIPAHAGARQLAKALGRPVTATSLNVSGQPATKSRRTISKIFPGLATLAGRCGTSKIPSTVVSVNRGTLTVIRPGAIRV